MNTNNSTMQAFLYHASSALESQLVNKLIEDVQQLSESGLAVLRAGNQHGLLEQDTGIVGLVPTYLADKVPGIRMALSFIASGYAKLEDNIFHCDGFSIQVNYMGSIPIPAAATEEKPAEKQELTVDTEWGTLLARPSQFASEGIPGIEICLVRNGSATPIAMTEFVYDEDVCGGNDPEEAARERAEVPEERTDPNDRTVVLPGLISRAYERIDDEDCQAKRTVHILE